MFGAVLGGIGLAFLATCALAVALVGASVLFLRIRIIVALLPAIACIVGALYYAIDDVRYVTGMNAVVGDISMTGHVIAPPHYGISHQSVRVSVDERDNVSVHHLRLTLYTELRPRLRYGDIVHARGRVVPPPEDSFGRYMTNNHLAGTLFYPEMTIVRAGGNPILSLLGTARQTMQAILNRHFSQEESALLHGILLGNRDEFSRAFLDKLSMSGTMHVTALSGLHMAIIVFMCKAVFRRMFFGREVPTFVATFITVLVFVALTGFAVSALRASMMAFLVALAQNTSRLYNPRNALALAAFVLTLINPKVPVFDIGFQLSFFATSAIIYFAPILQRFAFFQTAGTFAWRSILAITLSAQIAVLPLTIVYFSNFSLSMLPANIALLTVVPVMMALGFMTIGLGLIASALADVMSIPTSFLAQYALSVIEFFYTWRVPINPEVSTLAILLYYSVLLLIIARYSPAAKNFFLLYAQRA